MAPKKDKTGKAPAAKVEGNEEKAQALKTAIEQIKKKYGEGAVMRLGESGLKNIEVISTGSLGLDLATGVGGLPRGRIIEIFGPESSGKTTLALHCAAEAQKAGGIAAFVDAEHALDPIYAGNLGVDIDSLLVSQPDSGEQALEIAEALARSGAIDLIVVDSVAALVPKAEIDGDMGESHVGLQARLMSQALRKLAGVVAKSNAIVIFINQLREKVGVMYGNPEVTTGGRALKFYSTIRIDVRKGEVLKSGSGSDKELYGSRTRVKIVKNKVAPPFKETEFDIIYGKGISKTGDMGILKKSGAWFYYGDMRLGQGREAAKDYIDAHPDFAGDLERRIYAAVKGADDAEEEDAAAPAADSLPEPDVSLDIAVEDDEF